MPYTYPEGPQNVSDEILRPSAAFKAEVAKIVTSLFLFACLYFLLFAFSIGIAVALTWLAFNIILSVLNIWVIVFSLGLVAVGGLTVFFLIKFLFAQKTEDRSGYTEITEDEYPDLFEFIRRVSIETTTVFPKHIYLSQEVNAMVFYDSGFWSLFFPVRKNLVIGLGLVNMTNLSELKAVIAHEFGHFSQKSMKAGSYVYQTNKVIYNMLYENKDFGEVIDNISNIHGIAAFCMGITVKIIQAFQWILQQAYKSINKVYSGLSRQMEFDADAMAAKVAGSNNAIHALRRIEFADSSYNGVIEYYNQWLPEGYKGRNVYTQQRIVAKFLAEKYDLSMSGGLPILDDEEKLNPASFSRVNVKNQWASHPTMKEREASLKKINVDAPVNDESAWVLFPNANTIQEKLTERLYEGVAFKNEVKELDDDIFSAKFHSNQSDSSYPEFYKGYYNGRYMAAFAPEQAEADSSRITDLSAFLDEYGNEHKKLIANKEDTGLLDHIAGKQSGVRTFDFDGRKYKRSESGKVKNVLEEDYKKLEEGIAENDKSLYLYFLKKAGTISKGNEESVRQLYQQYYTAKEMFDANNKVYEHFSSFIQAFFVEQSMAQAAVTAQNLKEATPFFVSRIEKVKLELADIPESALCPFPEDIDVARIEYMSFTRTDGTFNDANLNQFIEFLTSFYDWNWNFIFKVQKNLSEQQLILSGHTS